MFPLVDRKLERKLLHAFARKSWHHAHPIPCRGDDLWKVPAVHNGCGRCLLDFDLSLVMRARTCFSSSGDNGGNGDSNSADATGSCGKPRAKIFFLCCLLIADSVVYCLMVASVLLHFHCALCT